MNQLTKKIHSIDQVGIVVKDLEKIKLEMKRIFGLDPVDSGIIRHKGVLYRGQPASCGVHIIHYDLFNIQIEFLSPVDGESIWKDFLDKNGPGLHHIRFNISDHEVVKKEMSEKGVETYQCGDSSHGAGIKFSYYDTEPTIGFIIETLNLDEIHGH